MCHAEVLSHRLHLNHAWRRLYLLMGSGVNIMSRLGLMFRSWTWIVPADSKIKPQNQKAVSIP
jgi:hypothetical protein